MTQIRLILLSIFVLLPMVCFSMTLRLTGNSIPTAFIQERLEQIAKDLYGPDARIGKQNIPSLKVYQHTKTELSVTSSDGTEHSVPITLTVETLPHPQDAFLLVSDHPEILRENGLLFSAGVIFLRPVRLNYYHENGTTDPKRAVVVRIDNRNDERALLHVIEAEAGPSKDEVGMGHQASLVFLNRHQNNLGRIVEVPPHDHVVLSQQMVKGGELVTGFLEVTELKGHPLQLSVIAEDPGKPEEENGFLLESHDTHARGAYIMPDLSFKAEYRVGEEPRTIPLGDLPLSNLLPGVALKGSYGMIWEGKIILDNPYDIPVSIPFYFQPRGGAATATFVLDQFFREVQATKPYAKVLLAEFNVPPKSKRQVSIATMPEGGSSYPVYLIIGRPSDL